MTSNAARCDLHCHTRYSDRPSEWLLRRLGAAESYTDPLALYRTCRERGMDFVTISDHNEIRGALEIAYLPGAFVSNEVTTYFPEDGCKVHCLVFGIDEAQFVDIQRVRANIYEFRDYLYDHDILYSVAHPLFAVNERLRVAHVEKLLVLFKRFEAINGARDPRASALVETIFGSLDAELVGELAARHRLDARDPEPWRKLFTAGSDDHSGLYLAGAWTETPKAATVPEFLAHLRAGAHVPAGSHGSSLKLAHSFYRITHAFCAERMLVGGGSGDLVADLLARFMRPEPGVEVPPAGGAMARVRETLSLLLPTRSGKSGKTANKAASKADGALLTGLGKLMALEQESAASPAGPSPTHEQRVFAEAGELSHELGYSVVKKLSKQLRRGRLAESVQSLAALGPVALCVAPYLAAFHTQHQDERLLDAVAARFPRARHLASRGSRRAWVTDTLGDLNGVSTTIRAVAAAARTTGRELAILTCRESGGDLAPEVVRFEPVGSFRLPEYEEQKLAFPPVLEVIAWCEREQVGELVISTPGPLGLAALAAAKLLRIRTTGIYHTDFPLYVRHRTESETLEGLTWRYMTWFFGQLDRVFVPSEAYRTRLGARGLDAARLHAMPRGVDGERFSPRHRDADFWRRRGLRGKLVFAYVGRLSAEKGLDALFDAFGETREALRAVGQDAGLAVVGDGPERKRLEREHRGRHVCFTGALAGEELSAAFASADVFVFPSTTDTFGNVVLEAQASGLPAIVSGYGGPQEIVGRTGGGLVVDVQRPGALATAMTQLAGDARLRQTLAERALAGAGSYADGWLRFADELWRPVDAEASTATAPTLAGRSSVGGLRSAEQYSEPQAEPHAEPLFIPGAHSF